MKKYLSLLLACVLALALLCACGKKDAAEQAPVPETPPTPAAWTRPASSIFRTTRLTT